MCLIMHNKKSLRRGCLRLGLRHHPLPHPPQPTSRQRLALYVWAEVVGGKKKGCMYGAGDLSSNYWKGSSRIFDPSDGASTSGNRRSQESAEITELKWRLAASEERERWMEQEQRQIEKTMQQMLARQREKILRLPPQDKQLPQPGQSSQRTGKDDEKIDYYEHLLRSPYRDF